MFLTLSQMKNLQSSKLKEFADDNFKLDENGRHFSKPVENTVTPVFSKDLFCRHVKTRLVWEGVTRLDCVETG